MKNKLKNLEKRLVEKRLELLENEVFKPMYTSYDGKNYRFQAGSLFISKNGAWKKVPLKLK
jgi:hypothetical protein